MSEAVASSNIFKQTQGTFIFKLHWVGSAIQFVSCTHLRTQFTHLRTELTVEAAEGLYCTGKKSDPGALNRKWPTPRLRANFISHLHSVSSVMVRPPLHLSAHL